MFKPSKNWLHQIFCVWRLYHNLELTYSQIRPPVALFYASEIPRSVSTDFTKIIFFMPLKVMIGLVNVLMWIDGIWISFLLGKKYRYRILMTRRFIWFVTSLEKVDVEDIKTIHLIWEFSLSYFSSHNEWINRVDGNELSESTDGKDSGWVQYYCLSIVDLKRMK